MSVMLKFSSRGTLKSTLTNAFLPAKLKLSIDCITLIFKFYIKISRLADANLHKNILFRCFIFYNYWLECKTSLRFGQNIWGSGEQGV